MTEIYEFALSDDGLIFSNFEKFTPGDVRELAKYVKFRTTVFGDFDVDDYRLRAFSGIAADATLQEGGFGLSPFGRFPFGDGGVCFDDENVSFPQGLLGIAGNLQLIAAPFESGTLALSGDIIFGTSEVGSLLLSGNLNVLVFASESGNISFSGEVLTGEIVEGTASLSGNLQVLVNATESGSMAMDGTLLYGPVESGSLSLTGSLLLTVFESGSMTLSGDLQELTITTESGSLALSGTLDSLVEPQESGSISLDGTVTPVLLTASSVLVNNDPAGNGTSWNTTTSALHSIGDFTSTASAGTPLPSQNRLPIAVSFQQIVGVLSAALTGGQSAALRMNVNGTGNNTLLLTVATPSTPSAALIATAVGNVDNGTHSYKVTFVINGFENAPSATSNTITADATHKQVTISSIATGPTGTTARKVYRTVSGNAGAYKLLTTINDNSTTSFTDNIADASLGANAPTGLVVGSATGTISSAQDDLIAIEATNFVGATSVSFNNVQVAYSAALSDGFLHTLRHYTGGATNSMGYIHKSTVIGWIQKQLTVNQGTITADGAPGTGTSYTLQLKKNNGATNVGTAMSLSGTNTSQRTTVNGVLPLTTTAANADSNSMLQGTTGSPASNAVRAMNSYQLDSPDGKVSVYTSGPGANTNWTVDGTSRFPPFSYVSTSTPTTTEANSQSVWPVTGTFKYLAVKHNIPVGTTVQFTLRINGASTSVLVSCAGTGANAWNSDFSDTVAVNSGDLVNFEYHRTAGAGTTVLPQIIIGFEA